MKANLLAFVADVLVGFLVDGENRAAHVLRDGVPGTGKDKVAFPFELLSL